MHAVVWCDTYTNLIRILDRRHLQDFELRVLFEMDANESNSLLDSPEAARLDVRRAICYDDGQDGLEKPYPFGPPAQNFLARLRSTFSVLTVPKNRRLSISQSR